MKLTAHVGLRDDRAKDVVYDAAAEALTDAAEHMLTESNRTIPHDEGTLERSGTVTVDKSGLRAAWGWDTPYAVRQHEDTRLAHRSGRRAKWAELTLREQVGRLGGFLAARIRGRVD